MKNTKIRVGITQGDINGIGYEVIIKALADPYVIDRCIPIVYGSAKAASFYRKQVNLENFNFSLISKPEEAQYKRVSLINCNDENIRVELGRSTQSAGIAAIQALDAAVADLKEGKIDVLVTGPINKQNVQSDSFLFPGHTEYLASAYNVKNYLMLMVSENMRVGVATGHIPLVEVSKQLSTELLLSKLKSISKSMIEDFAIHRPRIAVLGVNPHAGDEGVIGNEEQTVILPAIKQANEQGILAFGPYSPDGFFGSGMFSKFDVILAMYHDQGLIPFKTLAHGTGVNFTAGLPVVRTSPAHGTGYDIAGKNVASPDSMKSAIILACNVFINRKHYAELAANPLKKAHIAHGKDITVNLDDETE